VVLLVLGYLHFYLSSGCVTEHRERKMAAMMKMRKVMRSMKNNVMDYDDVQLRVREATSNDPTGPDDRLLARIAHDTRDRYSYNSMFTILWKRMTDLQQPSHVLKVGYYVVRLLSFVFMLL
jgi:epsin